LSHRDPAWIVENILLDSLLFRRILPDGARDVLDVGSGAGVPGIPLRLVDPRMRLTMVESRQRRASFLSVVVRDLGLTQSRVIGERLEDVIGELAGKFDVVVARCAGNVGYLFGLGAHLVRAGGVVIASGPPEEHALPAGRWIVVPGIDPGQVRRFAVLET
jgi:16S rRNA (guanine527-N7)-methyltransferase